MYRVALVYVACLAFLLPAMAQSNPVPWVSQPLVPTAAAPGTPSFTITVNGAGFVSGAAVNWNGASLTTTFISSSQLSATVPAANVATASTATITVSNPAPGGGTSNTQSFWVTAPTSQVTFSNIGLLDLNSASFVSVATDFNGDGKLDLVTADSASISPGNICVLLGTGDGGFQIPLCTYHSGSSWSALVSEDLNGDGKPDLVAIDSVSNLINIFLGQGDGTFQTAPTVNCCTRPSTITLADFNRDGKLDLAVSDDTLNATSFSVLLGNGDGTFQTAAAKYLTSVAYIGNMAVSDFDLDGKLDVAVEDSTGIDFLFGNGDGTFQVGTPILSLQGPASADLNGDGNPDLIAFNSVDDQLVIALGNGDGTFQTGVEYGYYWLIGLADLNGDGLTDLLVKNGSSGGTSLSLFLGNADSTLQTPSLMYSTSQFLQPSLLPVDFNNDGKPEFILQSLLFLQGSFPGASFSPVDPLCFGTVSLGKTSLPCAITLTNTGTANTTVSAITLSGANSADYSINSSTCGSTIVVNASCQVTVTFTPSAIGTRTAQLTVADDVPGNPATLTLNGVGIASPVINIAPFLTFTQQTVGTTSASQNVTISNAGNALANISSIAISGASASDFAQTNNCGNTLAINASCQATVTFTPTSSGNRTANLAVTDDAPHSPQYAILTGTGITSVVTLSPVSLSFPAQFVGTSGLPQTVTVTNQGTGIVSIQAVTATPADFGVVNSCGSSLAAGSTCSIAIFFDPTTGGTRAGTLTVTDGATGSPQAIALSGTGQDFSIAAPSPSATITAGQTATYPITISPNGGFTQPVALACTGTPGFSTCSVNPTSISLNGTSAATATVTVTTAPNSSSLSSPRLRKSAYAWALWLGLPNTFALLFLPLRLANKKQRRLGAMLCIAVLALFIPMAGCGGGNTTHPGTSPGTYSLSVTGTLTPGGTLNRSTKLTLTVQ